MLAVLFFFFSVHLIWFYFISTDNAQPQKSQRWCQRWLHTHCHHSQKADPVLPSKVAESGSQAGTKFSFSYHNKQMKIETCALCGQLFFSQIYRLFKDNLFCCLYQKLGSSYLNVYTRAYTHLKVYLHKRDCFVNKVTLNIFRCKSILFSTLPAGLNFWHC